MDEIKRQLSIILSDHTLSINEKYRKVVELIPNYLSIKEQRKALYEKIEWIFHDWLWTYFELILFDEIRNHYNINVDLSDKRKTIAKLDLWKALYLKFFPQNNYRISTINNGYANIPAIWLDPSYVDKYNIDKIIIDSGFHSAASVYK